MGNTARQNHSLSARRLAAIMFTDIVGYTALMGFDEDRAFEVLRVNRQIHNHYIEEYRGNLIKELGDGMLAQFDSAQDAVNCAIAIQKEAREKLSQKLRIGLHLGDITFDSGDVFGDGVNLASRLQSIADPGGIYISESIQKSIRANSSINTKYLGQFSLKNVSYPVSTYCILDEDLPIPSKSKIEELKGKSLSFKIFRSLYTYLIILALLLPGGWWVYNNFAAKTKKISSLLVLPFDNFTGTDTLEYFVAGIHDALIGDIGKIRALRVPSKRTANAYKNVDKSIPEIANELNIDAALETSVSCYGENICFQVKLVSAYPEEKQIWVEDFYIEKSELSNLSKRIAKSISQEIDVLLTPKEEQLLADTKPIDPDAYEAYLRGMSYWELGTKADLDRAMKYFQLAKEIDDQYALAYLGISRTWGAYAQHGFMPNSVVIAKSREAREKAFSLDSTLVEIHAGMATRYTWGEWNWAEAEKSFEKALEINPSYAFAQAYYSHFLAITGRAEEGLPHSALALELDPFNTLYQSVHGMALKNARKYEEALGLLLSLYATEPDQGIGLPALWAVLHDMGRYEEAIDIAREIYQLKNKDAALEALEVGYAEGGYLVAMQRIAERMIEESEKSYFPSWQISTLYCRAGMKDEAIYWLEKAYEEHDNNMPYISVDPLFDFMRDDPRFQEIARKMNFPQL